MVEQIPLKDSVVGSSPARGTIIYVSNKVSLASLFSLEVMMTLRELLETCITLLNYDKVDPSTEVLVAMRQTDPRECWELGYDPEMNKVILY